jgi:basic membrane protein A
MSKRSSRLALLFGAAVVVAACTSGASTSPSTAASAGASTEPSAAASTEPSAAASSAFKIGVQTDVGTINDKNFNQYSYAGAVDGAKAIGAPNPPAFVPKDPSEYPIGLDAYVKGGYNIVVVNGFNAVPEVVKAAKANPNVWFVGVDHDACLDAEGNNDPTFTCAGSANWPTLLPNYIGNNYQEDQVGYLAGIAAAKATKSNVIGAVGGITLCGPCVRYMQGYVLGAKSVNPDIKVKVAWVTDSDFTKAFADQALGRTFTEQFLKQNAGMDVVFQVAGLTGNGVIDAACAAGIAAIGVDVDQSQSYPDGAACTITSATKALQHSVAESIKAIADGSAKGGKVIWNAANDGVGFAPLNQTWIDEGKLPADTKDAMDAAFTQMKSGSLQTCPATDCGKTPAPPIGD